MAHRDAVMKSSQGPCHGGSGVTLDDNQMWFFSAQNRLQLRQHPCAHMVRRLPWLHELQVVVDTDAKQAHKGIQQVGMLGRGDIDGLEEVAPGFELVNDRSKLNDFRTRTKESEDLLDRCAHSVCLCLGRR